MTDADFLDQIDLLQELPPDLRSLVGALFEEKRYDDDQIVFRVGDPSTHLYVVKEGSVALFSDSIGEVVELKARVQPQGVFGEVGVLQGSGRTLSARASGPTTLLLLSGESLLELARSYEELALRLSKVALEYSFENRSSHVELARRKEARIRVGQAIELRVEGRESETVVLENLSLGGACIAGLPSNWDVGPETLVAFAVDSYASLFTVFGRVAWRRGDRLGLAFTSTTSDHEMRVAGALARLTGAGVKALVV